MSRFSRNTAFVCILAALAPHTARADAPKLVVVLVVDQMRGDYVQDYGSRWTKGLRRLLDEGAVFPNAAYPYMNTVTCAGHATIGTGTLPATHGIILNAWWDREKQKAFGCSDDPETMDIGYAGTPASAGHSAKRLLVPTFAETLRAAQDGSGRVVTFSLKPRSAIMLAGHAADAVTWFSGIGWTTSRSFSEKPVPFIERYAGEHLITEAFKASWKRLRPADAYLYSDDGVGEKPPVAWTRLFDHTLSSATGELDAEFFELWQESPWSDEYLADLAAEAVDALKLGRGAGTDFLGVSFSALDILGHDFGPRSHEVQDLLARLDVTIGRLLGHLDKRVGRGRYVVALSSDHGTATIPEQLVAEGKDAGRVIMNTIVRKVNDAVTGAFGPGRHVARMDYTDLYFMPGVFERIAAAPGLLEQVMQAIATVPGVDRVIDGRTLEAARSSADPLLRAAALSHVPGRSGDIIVTPRVNWFFVAADDTATPGPGSTHGTWHPYDARVPVIFMGAGIKSGVYNADATPADIAPTLARLCGIALPTATGRPLEEALATPVPTAALAGRR